jgi:CheY-like chemotaxis protein
MAQLISLVVDDDPDLRSVVARILRRDGFSTLEAENGEEALALVRSLGAKIAVVVSDIAMPVMDGCELANAVRAEFPGVPILLMSAYPDKRPAGCPFIVKPFTAQQLLVALRDALSGDGSRTV